MALSGQDSLSSLIKEKAFEVGFDLCGIAPVRMLKEYESVLKTWCLSGMNGDMNYLCRNIEKRIDPASLFPGAKSVIVAGLNYFSEKKQGGDGVPVISRYAYGLNYHDIIIEKLNVILDWVKKSYPGCEGKSFVDSSPILEKAWAREAGLGWQGRHSILINDKIGSFIFLGVILLDIATGYDSPFERDLCGTCRLCIGACPTGAINDNRTINATKCIAFQTIENKEAPPDAMADKMELRVFGCDRCQEVCPWNKHARPNKTPGFAMKDEVRLMSASDWKTLSPEKFRKLFKGTAIERRSYKKFMRNVTFVTKSVS